VNNTDRTLMKRRRGIPLNINVFSTLVILRNIKYPLSLSYTRRRFPFHSAHVKTRFEMRDNAEQSAYTTTFFFALSRRNRDLKRHRMSRYEIESRRSRRRSVAGACKALCGRAASKQGKRYLYQNVFYINTSVF